MTDGFAHSLRHRRSKLAIWGLGYIGYSAMAHYGRRGVAVLGTDIDTCRVEQVNAPGHGVTANVREWLGFDPEPLAGTGAMEATTEWKDLLAPDFTTHLVAVPTETAGRPWRAPLEDVLTKIVTGACHDRSTPPLVIIESTVAPGWFRELVDPIIRSAGLEVGRDVLLGVAPRRDWFGEPNKSLRSVPRVVGGTNPRTGQIIAEVVRLVSDTVFVAPDHIHAAMTKTVENAYRHVNITLANQLSAAYPMVNMREVLELAGTKWNMESYRPSLGIGGYCIPVAPRYLLEDDAANAELSVLRDSIESDSDQPLRAFDAAVRRPPKRVGILGVAYRADLKVHQQSPALRLMAALRRRGVDVQAHDPMYSDAELRAMTGVEPLRFPEELSALDVVVVSVAHAAYRDIHCRELARRLRPGALVLDNEGAWSDLGSGCRHITYRRPGDPGWPGSDSAGDMGVDGERRERT